MSRPTLSEEGRAIRESTLVEVNEVREKLGRRPLRSLPRAAPGDPARCAIAKALSDCAESVSVSTDCLRLYDDGSQQTFAYALSDVAADFIRLFDEKHYRDLVAPFDMNIEDVDDEPLDYAPMVTIAQDVMTTAEKEWVRLSVLDAEHEMIAERLSVLKRVAV